MALNFSTGFKDAILDTGSLKATFDDGFITIYAGTVPANADADLGGATALVTYSDGGAAPAGGTGLDLATAGAVAGAISKEPGQVWEGTAVATDTATFFRYRELVDAGGASTTAIRIQGTVGGGGADLFVTSTSFTSAVAYTLDMFSISIPNL